MSEGPSATMFPADSACDHLFMKEVCDDDAMKSFTSQFYGSIVFMRTLRGFFIMAID